jgi:hypothetical protein
MLVAVAVFYPVREAIGAFVWWKYRATYSRLDFVMTEIAPDGDIARGYLVQPGAPVADEAGVPSGEEWVLETARTSTGVVFASAPEIAAAPGARVPVWWSREAPGIGYGGGRATNIASVSNVPQLPGPWPFLSWSAVAIAALWLGAKFFVWTARKARIVTTETLLDR